VTGRMKNKPKPGGGVLDRSLVPRIEDYLDGDMSMDVDEVIEHLRQTYREYQRRQSGPFRQMVARAVDVIQRKTSNRPEAALQVCVFTVTIHLLSVIIL
jgi:tRNA A37 N6-isopentenylltransferase MiaA